MVDVERTLVLIPTYNEADNIHEIVSSVQSLGRDLDILFVDDNSPDGTGAMLDRLESETKNLHVMHRPGKLGIGTAHKDGIGWAYDHGYTRLITMDADLSHSPQDVPRLIDKAIEADIVVGSRFLHPDSLPGWAWHRKLMTHLGHVMTTAFLDLGADCTNAFRFYHLDRIPRGIFEMVESRGYSFFYESLHRLSVNGFTIAQIPISLPARTYGHSKMRWSDVTQSVKFLWRIGWQTRLDRRSLIYFKPFSGIETGERAQQEWDVYWTGASHKGKWIYDLIAAFYRRVIIRPAVNHFVKGNFEPGSKLLHAGSGGGAVDVDVARCLDVTALDISPRALTEYARNHGPRAKLLQSSIFAIPSAEGDFDGVFNLGVMEHFTEEEIASILKEFHRVLRPGGKIVLFWPPAYGLATRVLKSAHWIFKRLNLDIQLHPAELTHIRSRQQVENYLRRTGFVLQTFYFGIRDFFTHQIIVASKV